MKLRVVFFNALALVDRSACGTYAKAQIPHRPRKLGNQWAKLFFHFVICKKKKNVQVGEGKQHPAAVAPERKQSESLRFRGVQPQHVLEHPLKASIGELAQREQRFLRAGATFKRFADARSLVLA